MKLTLLKQCDNTESLIERIKSKLQQPGLDHNTRTMLHRLLNNQLDKLEVLWGQFGFKE